MKTIKTRKNLHTAVKVLPIIFTAFVTSQVAATPVSNLNSTELSDETVYSLSDQVNKIGKVSPKREYLSLQTFSGVTKDVPQTTAQLQSAPQTFVQDRVEPKGVNQEPGLQLTTNRSQIVDIENSLTGTEIPQQQNAFTAVTEKFVADLAQQDVIDVVTTTPAAQEKTSSSSTSSKSVISQDIITDEKSMIEQISDWSAVKDNPDLILMENPFRLDNQQIAAVIPEPRMFGLFAMGLLLVWGLRTPTAEKSLR